MLLEVDEEVRQAYVRTIISVGRGPTWSDDTQPLSCICFCLSPDPGGIPWHMAYQSSD